MRTDQIEALDLLEKAALRLEKARKEIAEASTEHVRAEQKARRVCPHIYSVPNPQEDRD